MNARSASLLGASVVVGTSHAFVTVPWWADLVMAILSAAIAFFSGRFSEPPTRGR